MIGSKHHDARSQFQEVLWVEQTRLVDILRSEAAPLAVGARLDVVLRLARARAANEPRLRIALSGFQEATRPALVDYLACVPAGLRPAMLHPLAVTLAEHFDRFTEVPVSGPLVKRVVISAYRKLRARRKAASGHEH